MATVTSNDGSEDVSDFLRRIQELGSSEAPDTEDLEQEIIESKRQREARRAERARSLSPDKQTPVVSPTSSARSPVKESFSSPRPLVLSPPPGPGRDSPNLSQAASASTQNLSRPTSSTREVPALHNTSSTPASPAVSTPPLRQSTSLQRAQLESEPSRAQIAKSLGEKDPTWFRQTSDRGLGSAAYIKSKDEEDAPRGPRKLHGLSIAPEAPDTGRSFEKNAAEESLPANNAGPSTPNEPLERSGGPVSPTKGMGGFVQSAMLRRTESVNKRWSAQTAAGAPRMNRPDEIESSATAGPRESAQERGSVSAQSRRSRSPTKTNPGDAPNNGERTPSHSPQKRWSPQKSSWLESALNKPPESPRLRHTPSQPSWLTDLNKTKQARMSKDEGQMSPARPESISTFDKKMFDEQSKEQNRTGTSSSNLETSSPPAAGLEETPTTALSKLEGRAEPTVIPAEKTNVVGKPKPMTPPKKNVQSFGSMPGERKSQASQGELEFQSAFGKLKRTQTDKYVAPDELKENVLRGKAGLAATGGPQKSERRDEFRESLLKKKATMNETGANLKSAISRPTSVDKKPAVPEAIARRRAMTGNQNGDQNTSTPESNGKPKPQPAPTVEALPRQSEPGKVTAPAGLNGRLAGRLNPALAGMIARGPQQASKESTFSSGRSESPRESPASGTSSNAPAPLDHMTRSRARGPKRRPPKTTQDAQQKETAGTEIEASKGTVHVAGGSLEQLGSRKDAGVEKNPKPDGVVSKALPPQAPTKPQTLATKRDGPAGEKSIENRFKPVVGETANPSPVKTTNGAMENRAKTTELPRSDGISQAKPIRVAAARWGQPAVSDGREAGSPKQPIKLPTQQDEDNATREAGLVRAENGNVTARKPPSAARLGTEANAPSSSLTPASARQEEVEAKTPTKSSHQSPKSPSSDASQTFDEFFEAAPRAPASLTINVAELLSLEQPGQSHKSKTIRKQMQELSGDGKTSGLPPTQEHILYSDKMYLCTHVFGDESGTRRTEVFFWVGSRASQASTEDAHVFAKRAAKEAGGTLQVVRQGKESGRFFQAVGGIVITRRGSGQARTGFMLCGRKHLGHVAFDEVELAAGSLCSGFAYIVSPGSKQGSGGTKEEEERGGKLFLWKGKGCSADEVGCARLISMDLGGPGEVEEAEEGSEPEAFLDALAGSSGNKGSRAVPRSAEHWKLKAQQGNYSTRLFHVECARPEAQSGVGGPGAAALWNLVGRRGSQADTSSTSTQRVREIHPFCQADLEPGQIYVLDAFFEMYVLVGPASQGQASSFATALMFAQDYGILAAGQQDRPFVPVGTVVMQGAPRDLKACFRGWDESNGLFADEDAGRSTPGKERKKLRIVPLSAALVAVRP